MDTKICTKCKEVKNLTEFRTKNKLTGTLRSWCKKCLNTARSEYSKKNHEKERLRQKIYSKKVWAAETEHFAKIRQKKLDRDKSSLIKWHLKKKFSLSLEEYNKMLADQNGVCAICELPPTTRRLGVDHDHATSKIRGLLCYNCNTVLGLVRDSQDTLVKTIDYLKRYS